jgi:hypothetical protein
MPPSVDIRNCIAAAKAVCEVFHIVSRPLALDLVTKTPKWVLGCEARPKGLTDNRSVQDTPRRG